MQIKKIFGIGSILGTAMCASVAYAAPALDTLVITQNSTTSLTVDWDGTDLPSADVFNTAPDEWRYSLPDFVTGAGQWVDPNTSGDVNQVGAFLGFFGGAAADVGPNGFLSFVEGSPLANDTANTSDFWDIHGNVSVTFDDESTDEPNGPSAGLPDSTTTMPLLGLAFAGLCGFAKRFRK